VKQESVWNRRCRLHTIWQSVPENRGCDSKRATASCWQTLRRDAKLQRERRPQTATTWHARYRNKLVQIRWRHTVQHSVCHKCQFKVDPFWQTQPVQYCECVRHVVIATKSEYQPSCGVDPVAMARMLTCLYGKTVFPGVEEPCCLW